MKKQNLPVGALFLLPFVLLGCVTFLLFSSYREMDQSLRWVAHSHEVNTRLQNLLKNLLDAETGQRGYVLTARLPYLEPYQKSIVNASHEFALLQTLTRDNALQQENLSQLKLLMEKQSGILARTITLKKQGRDSEALRLVLSDEGKQSMDEIRRLMEAMAEREALLLRQRKQKADFHAKFNHHLAVSLMLLDTVALASIVYMLKRMQSLKRIVTVCAWSKTIQSNGRWISFESYLREQFGISVSHGMSNEVYNKLMNEPEPPTPKQGPGA